MAEPVVQARSGLPTLARELVSFARTMKAASALNKEGSTALSPP